MKGQIDENAVTGGASQPTFSDAETIELSKKQQF